MRHTRKTTIRGAVAPETLHAARHPDTWIPLSYGGEGGIYGWLVESRDRRYAGHHPPPMQIKVSVSRTRESRCLMTGLAVS